MGDSKVYGFNGIQMVKNFKKENIEMGKKTVYGSLGWKMAENWMKYIFEME